MLSLAGISSAGNLVKTSELFSVVASVPGGASSEGRRLPGARPQGGQTHRATIFGAVDSDDGDKRPSVSAIAIFDRKAGGPGFAWGGQAAGPVTVPQ
jgi:hypothetical protein